MLYRMRNNENSHKYIIIFLIAQIKGHDTPTHNTQHTNKINHIQENNDREKKTTAN